MTMSTFCSYLDESDFSSEPVCTTINSEDENSADNNEDSQQSLLRETSSRFYDTSPILEDKKHFGVSHKKNPISWVSKSFDAQDRMSCTHSELDSYKQKHNSVINIDQYSSSIWSPTVNEAAIMPGFDSYICKVVGGVAQKYPVNSNSPGSSPGVKRRPKPAGRIFLNRRVSCKDLGKGDCEGWLFKRRQHSHGLLASHWDKRWCVIKRYYLYCYHTKDSEKAEIVIHLPAFQVSPVDHHELKTKKFAFKVHNTGTFFTFASDRQEDMSKWMNKMGLAAIAFANERPKIVREAPIVDKDFSESEDEDPPTLQDSSHQPASDQSQTSTDTPQEGASLMAPTPELRSSQVDLSVMLRRQSERGHNLYGEDKNATRRSVLSREVLDQIEPELGKLKKLKSLQRTLKAKEKELAELEDLLQCKSPEKIRMVKDVLGGAFQTD